MKRCRAEGTAVGGVVIVAAALLAAAFRKRRPLITPNGPSSELAPAGRDGALGPADEPTTWSRLSLTTWSVASLLLVGAMVLGATFYFAAQGSQAPPPTEGEIRLYFDRPGIESTLDVFVADDPTGLPTTLHIRITAAGDTPDRTRFFLTLTSDAASDRRQWVGGPETLTSNGCWAGVIFTGSAKGTCSDIEIEPDLPGSGMAPVIPAQLITGVLYLDTEGTYETRMTLRMTFDAEVDTGTRSFFVTPSVGITSFPGLSDSLPLPLAEHRAHIPLANITIVQHRELTPGERVEAVAPTPIDDGLLTWVEDGGSVAASASVIDITEEASEQDQVLASGFLVGFSTAFLPAALAGVWRHVRGWYRQRRTQTETS